MTPRRQHADVPQFSPVRLKAFIETRLARREAPERIANAVRAYFEIPIESEQIVPYWKGEITLPTQTGPTQTGHRQDDDKSVEFPADAMKESLFTRMPDGETAHLMSESETPGAVSEPAAPAPFTIAPDFAEIPDGARGEEAPPTQTGRRQDNKEPLQIPADAVDAPSITREARDAALEALGAHVKAKLGIAPDPALEPAPATQTGCRQNQKTSVLTDAMKAFIVRGLARYETPTRVAASVQAQFGIAIDRRQVYAYDPAGSRPPAQRWIDLHEATRAKFLGASAEIGVAQKVVRLRMLDRFANRADENYQLERAARFLDQAAKECGGFYERFARPKVTAAPPQ